MPTNKQISSILTKQDYKLQVSNKSVWIILLNLQVLQRKRLDLNTVGFCCFYLRKLTWLQKGTDFLGSERIRTWRDSSQQGVMLSILQTKLFQICSCLGNLYIYITEGVGEGNEGWWKCFNKAFSNLQKYLPINTSLNSKKTYTDLRSTVIYIQLSLLV